MQQGRTQNTGQLWTQHQLLIHLLPPALASYDPNCGIVSSEASSLDLAPSSTLPPSQAFSGWPPALDAGLSPALKGGAIPIF